MESSPRPSSRLPPGAFGAAGVLCVAAAGVALAIFLSEQSSKTADEATEEAEVVEVKWIAHPTQPFAIMAYEATVSQFKACLAAAACDGAEVEKKCNLSQKDRENHPVNCVTFTAAEQFCAWVGGRVCTQEEWLAACRGTDGRGFPYGGEFDPEACNVHSRSTGPPGSTPGTAPVGSHRRCEGGLDGLFDMAGNVAEWVGPCKGTYCRFRGAGHRSNEPVERFAACRGVCSGNQGSLKSNVVGIRCCKDRP